MFIGGVTRITLLYKPPLADQQAVAPPWTWSQASASELHDDLTSGELLKVAKGLQEFSLLFR